MTGITAALLSRGLSKDFRGDLNSLNPNIAASRLHAILRQEAWRFGVIDDHITLKYDRQRYCRGAYQISGRFKPEHRGFKTSRDLVARRLVNRGHGGFVKCGFALNKLSL